MSSLINESRDILDQIITWRRDLHQIPETELDLEKTSAYVQSELDKLGISYQVGLAKTGVVAIIQGNKEGKTIALRADMDALPMKERTGATYASTNDNMHSCGHDAHTAMLLGAAKLLKERRNDLSGNVKLIFQPAEEQPGGAKIMIEEGVLENPKVDAIIGLHVGNIVSGLEYGKVGIKANALMAASDIITLKIKGVGCHGSAPHNGTDPITIAGYVVTALQQIVSREVKATEPMVLSFGKISGGTTFNVIPEEVELTGMVRTFSPETRSFVRKRFEEITNSVVTGLGGECEIDYFHSYPPLINDPELTAFVAQSAEKILSKDEIVYLEEPVMGAEDMSYYLEEIPGAFFFLGTNNPEKGITYSNHSSKFDVDEEQLWKGPALMAQTCIDWLNQ